MAFKKFPYRWWIVALLFVLSAINYLDRQTLSVLSKTLQDTLGFTPVEYSYVITSFLVAYTLGYIFCGQITDRLGVRLTVVVCLGGWSLAAMGHALATSWVSLLAWRFLLGIGESFSAPCGIKALSEWAPKRERALSIALFSNGTMAGAIIAPPLVAFLATHFGWQWAFIVTGALGFVYLILWLMFYNSPEEQTRLSPEERDYIIAERGSSAPSGKKFTYREALKHPATKGFFVTRLLTDPTSFFFSFWLAEYLQTARGFSLAMIGFFAWIPFLAADVGGPGGGALSDWLVRRGWPTSAARRRIMLIAACLMPCSVLAVHIPSDYLAIAFIGIVLAAQACWMSNTLALLSETFPREKVGTFLSISAVGGSIGGVIATLISGQLIARIGYVPVFTALGFMHLIAFIYMFKVSPVCGVTERLEPAAEK